MDLKSLIITGTIVLYMLLPFIWMGVSNARRVKMLRQGLFSFAKSCGHRVSKHNLWDDSLIGIDVSGTRLFFQRNVNGGTNSQQVDLAKIKDCRILKLSRTVKGKDVDYQKIENVGLVLTHFNAKGKETLLEFYNASYDTWTSYDALLLASRWSTIINQSILANDEKAIGELAA